MANNKSIVAKAFKFQPFSKKQLELLSWWTKDSPYKDKFICVADGSVRCGKSIIAITSFILFLMSNFNYQNASISGKTVMTARRNLVNPLKQICLTLGVEVIDHRSENFLELRQGKTCNLVYIFGGKIFATYFWKLK